MGFGFSQYIPYIIYGLGILSAALSIFSNPLFGIFFLFPLLPYASTFEKLKLMPLGKDLNDVIIACILIGFMLKRAGGNSKSHLNEQNTLRAPVLFIIATSLMGLFNATLYFGLSFDIGNRYLVDWKNYMLFPLIWFLTYKNLLDKKKLKMLTFLLILGTFGVSYYFYSNLKWLNLWHFSYRIRDSISGLFVNLGANHYGAFFTHFVFIPLAFFLTVKSVKMKVLMGIVIALCVYCIMYTFSRGAYLAFLTGILFLGIVKDKKVLLLLLLFFIFWRSLVPISVAERIDMTRNEQGELEQSAADRVMLWERAKELFGSSPVWGTGFNTFNFAGYSDPHNYYLKMLAELGILGLFAFLFLCFRSFTVAWSLYKRSNDEFFKSLGLGFSACVVAVLVTNFFGNRWSYLCLGAYFWIYLGIIIRAGMIEDSEAHSKRI